MNYRRRNPAKIATFLAVAFIVACDSSSSADQTPPVVPAANVTPTANAGSDISADESTTVTLLGTGSDTDGTISSFSWTQVSGASVSLSDASAQQPSFDAPKVNAASDLEFELTVTDNDGATASDRVVVSVLNADNSFEAPTGRTSLPVIQDFTIMLDIVSWDLNGDQLNDLILLSTGEAPNAYVGAAIQVLINDGAGAFSDETSTYFPSLGAIANSIDKLYAVDLDNDGRVDLVPNSQIPPLLRQSDGTFELLTGINIDPAAVSIFSPSNTLAPIDFDGDGDQDMVRIDVFDDLNDPNFVRFHDIRISENVTQPGGAISFGAWSSPVAANDPQGGDQAFFVMSPAVLDFDEDGDIDFVYGGPTWDQGVVEQRVPVYFMRNNGDGDGSFTETASNVFANNPPTFTHVREFAVADIDGSNRDSIVVANHGFDGPPFPGENNAVLTNLGGGMFAADVGTPLTHDYRGFTHSLAVGDINNDGATDIVYVDLGGQDVPRGSMNLRVLLNNGGGTFQDSNLTLGPDLELQTWTTSFLIDLNNDDYPEIVLGAQDRGSENLVFWNRGDGTFVTTAP